VGAITTPIINQAKTCSIINRAKKLAIPTLCKICIAGRSNNVRIIVDEVAIRFAGIKKAQMLMQ
jgi:hypothetical protein